MPFRVYLIMFSLRRMEKSILPMQREFWPEAKGAGDEYLPRMLPWLHLKEFLRERSD
jgi:hypothetical protein